MNTYFGKTRETDFGGIQKTNLFINCLNIALGNIENGKQFWELKTGTQIWENKIGKHIQNKNVGHTFKKWKQCVGETILDPLGDRSPVILFSVFCLAMG